MHGCQLRGIERPVPVPLVAGYDFAVSFTVARQTRRRKKGEVAGKMNRITSRKFYMNFLQSTMLCSREGKSELEHANI